MQLSGWHAVAALLIGAGLAALGAWLPSGGPLIGLGGAIIGGVLGVSQPQRSPYARDRMSDELRSLAAVRAKRLPCPACKGAGGPCVYCGRAA